MNDPTIEWVSLAEVPMPTEAYVLIRPTGRHPARGTAYLPTIAFRRDSDPDDTKDDVRLYSPENHIEALMLGSLESFDEETGRPRISEVELEWMYIPGMNLEETGT